MEDIPLESPPTEALTHQPQGQGSVAFTEIYGEVYKNMVRFTKTIVGPDAAEDVVQDTMLKFWTKFEFEKAEQAGHPHAQALGWLYTTSRNRSFNYLRDRNNKPTISIDGFSETIPSMSPDPFKEVWLGQIISALGETAGQLDEDCKKILSHILLDSTVREIAQDLGITESNAKVRVHRLRKRVIKIIAEEIGDPGITMQEITDTN